MLEHTAPISGLACSNKYVATAGYDNRVLLWQSEDSEVISRGWHDHLVNHCDFSPDQTRLLTSSSDYSSRIWSLPEMRLLHVNVDHSDDVMRGFFSPSGEYYATCSCDGTLKVYSGTNDLLATLTGHTGIIENFCWSRDSKFIFSCGMDDKLIKWDPITGQKLSVFENGGPDMDAIANLSNGGIIVGNDHGELCVFSDDLGPIAQYQVHQSGVKNIVASPDASEILSVGYDGVAKISRIDNALTEVASAEFPASIWARSADFHSDGTIAFGTFSSRFAKWDYRSNAWEFAPMESSVSLNGVSVKDGNTLTIGDAGIVHRNGEPIGGPESLCNFVIEADGVIFCGGQTGELYAGPDFEVVHKNASPLNCAVTMKHEGKTYLCVGSYAGEVLVFETGGAPQYLWTLNANENAIKGMDVKDGSVITGCADGQLVMLDPIRQEITAQYPKRHTSILNDACFVGSDLIGSISRDLTLIIWSANGSEIHETNHQNSIKSIASDTDGRWVAMGDYRGSISVFNVETRAFHGAKIRASETGISSLAWDASKSQFVASSYDGHLYEIEIFEKSITSKIIKFPRVLG